MTTIKLENLGIERGGKTLFEAVDLEIGAGEKVVITGPSGSGKTSILMAVMGTFAPSRGRVLFEGIELSRESIAAVRAAIAFISQEPVMGAGNIEDALLLPFSFRANRSVPPERGAIEQTLHSLHLESGILRQACSKVSAGEKQRIAIARALLLGKKVFLVDEATSALDPASKAAVAGMLERHEYTILSVSHDTYWIERCQRVLQVADRGLDERRTGQ
jgi:putative ABC transport system ATP-binding protein